MKNITKVLLGFLLLGFLSGCTHQTGDTDLPQATIKGYIKGILPEKSDLRITVANSVTGDIMNYYLPVDSAGQFELTLPLAFLVAVGANSRYITTTVFYLSPGKTSVLKIDVDENSEAKVQVEDETNMSMDERYHLYSKTTEILMNTSVSEGIDSVLPPDAFRKHMTDRIEGILSLADSDTILPSQGKNILKAELKSFYTQGVLMEYEQFMGRLIAREETKPRELQKPDISYYSFLKDINLSDTALITTTYYHFLLRSILECPVFGLKSVEDTESLAWVNDAKEKLGKVVGDGQELFYKMLLANSYSNQLNQMKPFSEKQIQNIRSYYKEDNIGKVLLAENHKVNILLSEGKKEKETVVGYDESKEEKIGTDRAESFMAEMFEKYKDKIIVVDFWATWCGPCLKSIEEISQYKKGYIKKDIVFVYITNESSPAKTWEEMKKDIKGDHYYVNNKVWEQLTAKYEFSYIPHIVIFGKDRKMIKQIGGYTKDDKTLPNTLDELL